MGEAAAVGVTSPQHWQSGSVMCVHRDDTPLGSNLSKLKKSPHLAVSWVQAFGKPNFSQ